MSRNTDLCSILAACALWAVAPGDAVASMPAAVDGQPVPTLAPMLKRVTPAVVNIASTTRMRRRSALLDDPFFRRFFDLPETEQSSESLGSGVIVDARRGHILTNHHLIEGADEITVTLKDGRTLQARVIGSDPDSDITVLKIDADHLTAIPLADSNRVQVGDFVVAIGNPFGLSQTVTSGIVSALGRSGLGIEGYEDFIQTDASINPGNSGGALVNLRGELVGINTAIYSPGGAGGNVGIGFAIPTRIAQTVMVELLEYGHVRHGRLGAQTQDLTPELATALGPRLHQGAVVAEVEPESAAEQAGLRSGDVVVAADGRPVRRSADLDNAVGFLPPGQLVVLDVVRQGRHLRLQVRLSAAALGKLDGERLNARLAGALLGEVRSRAGSRRRPGTAVQVLQVEPGSVAWSNGLRAGDVILSANHRSVDSLSALRAAVSPQDDNLLLNILRGSTALFALIR